VSGDLFVLPPGTTITTAVIADSAAVRLFGEGLSGLYDEELCQKQAYSIEPGFFIFSDLIQSKKKQPRWPL